MQILGGLIVSLYDLPSSVRGLLVLQMLGGGLRDGICTVLVYNWGDLFYR